MNYKLYKTINDIKISNIQEREPVSHAIEDLYELWQLCFEDSDLYTDFYFKWKVKENQILSIYNKNGISSMLHLNPYTLRVKGRKVLANYIVGVATRKEDRRQGLMKILLEEALKQMYEDKMEFTYLMPASEDIYHPFDFRVVYEQEPWNDQVLNYQRKQISDTKANNERESSLDIVILEETDQNRLNELVQFTNAVLAKQTDIYVERYTYYYIRLLKEMHSCYGEVLLLYEQGKLVGYVSYMAEEKIYITEMIYLPDKREIVMQAVSDYFENILKKSIFQREIDAQKPSIMARIVNWNTFVENMTATQDMELIIKVTDPILEQNDGVYSLQFTNQGCTCRLSHMQPEMHATIADLNLLFFGKIDRNSLAGLINNGNTSISKETINNVIDKINRIQTYNKLFINDVV